MSRPVYSLRLAWESEQHSPEWELQTEHPGFTNWAAPALFANRALVPHPVRLELTRGRLVLRVNTGLSLELAGDGAVTLTEEAQHAVSRGIADPRANVGIPGIVVTAWRLVADGHELVVATCESYREMRGARPGDMSRCGLDGIWLPRSFEVIGPQGHVPVTIEPDETGHHIVAVLEQEPVDQPGVTSSAIALIAKA